MPMRTQPDAHSLVLATHGGTFHLDDVFAYAVLRLALGLTAKSREDCRWPGQDHALVRTRDEAVLKKADLVWDVGGVHDPAAGRFDHHQRGAPVREDGTPLSAAGLVWRAYGVRAIQALLVHRGAADLAPTIAAVIEREVVRRIDELDNGVGQPDDALGLSALVEDFNPSWNAPEVGDGAAEDAFLLASDLAGAFLGRRAEAVRARLAADAAVVAAHRRSPNPRILELGRKMPWEEAAHAHGLPVLYAVYPVPNGNWMVDAMPTRPGAFEQRRPLPAAWAGQRDTEFAVRRAGRSPPRRTRQASKGASRPRAARQEVRPCDRVHRLRGE
jgi:uncharacterized UPF0160 family protein